jgi:DNA polymerase-3 subunit alpha
VASTLEKIGLLKMDFLGLINLSILSQAIKNVKQTTGVLLDVRGLPLDDAKTYELLGNGECVGVFQLEGQQMRRYIQELKPSSVRDVAAMVALYRPGPMNHIPTFVRCKHGKEKIKYLHPSLEAILEETYGVIVYQDQVMLIAQVIAGYTLGQADILRRAMGKKKKEEMIEQRANFLDGAAAKGVSKAVANKIFDLMEPFAGYAFNKAHAVCYAMVAYQTAYLKANYPVEYMAALLTCFIEKPDKLVTCMDECKRMNIPVLPPDINASSFDFTVDGGGIRFGLAAIKNVGKSTVETIIRARSGADSGPYTGLADFCDRVMCSENGAGAVTRATIEALIQAGAFSNLPGHGNRRALVQMLDAVLLGASKAQRDKRAGQSSLADMFGDTHRSESMPVPNVSDYGRDQILAFERELLGLYISDHPLQAMSQTFEREGVKHISELAEMQDRAEVTLGGIVSGIKPFTAKRSGEPMAFFTLEDVTGSVSCTMFPKVYAQYRDSLVKDKIVLLKGKTSYRDRVRDAEESSHNVEVLADSIQLINESGAGAAPRKIVIRLDGSKRDMLRFVKEAVDKYRGNGESCPVYLRITDSDTIHEVRTPMHAEFNEPFRADVEHILGASTVWVE